MGGCCRLAAGEAVPFSANLRLSAAGLLSDAGELAWAEYGGAQVANGTLRLLRGGETWLALPLPQVDNIPVLLNLLRTHKS